MDNKPAGAGATGHFGRQVRKERLARGWTLQELSARTGIDMPALSRLENGRRPPNEKIAIKLDEVFPERRGYFLEYYEESKTWMPPGFKDWNEYESKARELIIWSPGAIDGVAQTEGYASALILDFPGVTAEIVEARLKSRIARQLWLLREDGPRIVLLVDMCALYRATGSAEIMVAQCARLIEIAALENVTVQVVPPVSHPLATALAIIADDAAYTENALGGAVFTADESVDRLRRLVDKVRGEARPVSESLAIIREAHRQWSGVSRATAATAGRRASKPRRRREP
jgi:DNA-binding XRE family transcriptional regulator